MKSQNIYFITFRINRKNRKSRVNNTRNLQDTTHFITPAKCINIYIDPLFTYDVIGHREISQQIFLSREKT